MSRVMDPDDWDTSKVDGGLNNSLYFVQTAADGGKSKCTIASAK